MLVPNMTRFQTRTTLSAIFVGTGEKYVVQFFSAHHLVQLSRRKYRSFSLLVQWTAVELNLCNGEKDGKEAAARDCDGELAA